MLKTVGVASSFLALAAFFIAGWKTGANAKPIPIFLTHSWICLAPSEISIPRASSRSAAPLFELAARLPCLIVLAPAAVVMMAAVVEILIVDAPSPPVPTMSTARSGISIAIPL